MQSLRPLSASLKNGIRRRLLKPYDLRQLPPPPCQSTVWLMPPCDTCGNPSRPMLKIVFKGKTYRFDSFECAVHKLAPRCEHCGCRIIGHVVDALEHPFCSVQCAAAVGVSVGGSAR